MEAPHIKCSSKIHQDLNAICYCQECRLYMCEKCQNIHAELYNHSQINIKENQLEIFTGICKEENHINYLDFFCKTHNKLCCLACVSKINKKGYGQHKDCDICIIEEIKEEKKLKFNENIKEFENLSNNINESINRLKNIFDEINNKKEEMKIQIQKIFTKIRSELNDREDFILKKIDKKFENSFIKEENIKKYEKLPKQIKKVLDEINSINIEWDIEKLNFFLNSCENIENNINNIKKENEDLQNLNKFKILNINYNLKNLELDNILEKIKTLGNAYYEYEFEPCENKDMGEYLLSGENENIVTKIAKQNWIRILSKNILNEQKEYNFKIRIVKSKAKQIMIGIAQIYKIILNKDTTNQLIKSINDAYGRLRKSFLICHLFKRGDKFDLITNLGWYFSVNNSSLFSDAPHNFRAKGININNIQEEIKMNINIKDRTMSLLDDNNNKKILYDKIPVDIPLCPSVLLFDEEDSIEILPL